MSAPCTVTRLSPCALSFRFPSAVRVTPALRDPTRWGVAIVGGAAVEVRNVVVAETARVVDSVTLWLALPAFQALLQINPDLSGLVRDSDGGSFASPGFMRVDAAVGGAGAMRRYRWLEIQGIPEDYPSGFTVPWSPDGGADPGRTSRAEPRVTIPGEYFAAGGLSMLGAKLDLQRGRTASIETLGIKLVDLDGRLVALFATQAAEIRMALTGRIEKADATVADLPMVVRYGADSSGAFDTSGGAVYAFSRSATLKLASRATVDATNYEYDVTTAQAGSGRAQLTEGTPVTDRPAFFHGRVVRLWEVDLALSATPKCLFAGVMDEPQSEDLVTWTVRAKDMSALWNKATFAERLSVLATNVGGANPDTSLTSYGLLLLERDPPGEGTTDATPKTAVNTDLQRVAPKRGWDQLPNADCETSRGYQDFANTVDNAVCYLLTWQGPRRYRLLAADQHLSGGPSAYFGGSLSDGGGIRRNVYPLDDEPYDLLTVEQTRDEVSVPYGYDPGDLLVGWLWQTGADDGNHKTDPGVVEEVLRLDNQAWPAPDGVVRDPGVAACLLRLLTSTGLGTNGDYDVLPDNHALGIDEADVDVASFEREATNPAQAFGYLRPEEDGGLFDLLAERVAHPAGLWLLHTRAGTVRLKRLSDLLEHESPTWGLTPQNVCYNPAPSLTTEIRETFNAVAWKYDKLWLESSDVLTPPVVNVPEYAERVTDSSTFTFKSPMVRIGAPGSLPLSLLVNNTTTALATAALRQLALLAQATELYTVTVPAVEADSTDWRDCELGDVVGLLDIPVNTRRGTRVLGAGTPIRALCVGTRYDPNTDQVTLTLSNCIGRTLRGRGFSFAGHIVDASTRYVWVLRDGLHTAASQALQIPVGLAVGDDVRVRWSGADSSPAETTLAEVLACEAVGSGPGTWRLDFGVAGVPSGWFHELATGGTTSVLKVAGDQTVSGNGRFWEGLTVYSNDPGRDAGGHTLGAVSFDGVNTLLTISPVFSVAPTAGSWVWTAGAVVCQPTFGDASTAARKFAHLADGEWTLSGDGLQWLRPPARPTVGGDPVSVTVWS